MSPWRVLINSRQGCISELMNSQARSKRAVYSITKNHTFHRALFRSLGMLLNQRLTLLSSALKTAIRFLSVIECTARSVFYCPNHTFHRASFRSLAMLLSQRLTFLSSALKTAIRFLPVIECNVRSVFYHQKQYFP